MNPNSDNTENVFIYKPLIAHAAARSLRFWGSLTAYNKQPPIFPLTAYNALTGSSIYAGRQGLHNPAAYNLIKLTTAVLESWHREFDSCSIQQLRWALTNIPTAYHSQILKIFTTESIEGLTMKDTITNIPQDVLSKLTMSLASLEQSLLEKDPMMPQHLRASHQLLISYPETVHLLEDAEIARLIGAMQIHTQVEIVKLNTPKTGGRKKISADDL